MAFLGAFVLCACTRPGDPGVTPAASASAHTQQAAPSAVDTATLAADKESPVQMSLDVGDWPKVKLRNVSSQTHKVFYSRLIQPAVIHLFDGSGTEITATDQRAVMKFNNNITASDYDDLAPGEVRLLDEAKLPSEENEGILIFGTFSFRKLRPGSYRLVVEWLSERDDYVEDVGADAVGTPRGTVKIMPGVWKGTLKSAEISLVVPETTADSKTEKLVETSATQTEPLWLPANHPLCQGKYVEETGSDGITRRVWSPYQDRRCNHGEGGVAKNGAHLGL